MEYHKNNKVLIDFFTISYMQHLKATLLSGKIRDGSISKYRKAILNLCKIVSQRLEEEKEILERIKNLQEINN